MTDQLDPRAPTWARPDRPAETITDSPAWYRRIAATERDPKLAASYLELAESIERYLQRRGVL